MAPSCNRPTASISVVLAGLRRPELVINSISSSHQVFTASNRLTPGLWHRDTYLESCNGTQQSRYASFTHSIGLLLPFDYTDTSLTGSSSDGRFDSDFDPLIFSIGFGYRF